MNKQSFILIVAAFVFMVSCAPRAPKYEGEFPNKPGFRDAFITASLSDASFLNPVLATDSASNSVNAMIFNGLLRYDENLILVPDLAESFEVSENGLEIIFNLRRGVLWHDGKPFTARDVEFTFQRLIDPTVKTPFSSNYTIVESFEVINDYTIRITYAQPFAPVLESWGMSILPAHVFEGYDFNTAPANRAPIGTGPYKFVSWRTDQKIILRANENYFRGRPYINHYVIRVIPNQSVQFLELRNQSIDSMALTPDQWYAYSRFFENYSKFDFPAFSFTFLGFNLTKEPFNNPKFIKAIDHAINKEDIIQGVLLGRGVRSTGIFPPQSWAHNPNIAPREFSPQKAVEMLESIGFEHSGGTLLYNGIPFEFTITTNQGNKPRALAAQIIQQNLRDIGIRANIRIIDFGVFVNQIIANRNFEAVILGWNTAIDPDQFSLWHSSQTGARQYNFMSYNNPRVDYLFVKARTTFDRETRRKAYFEIQEIMREHPPCIFLFHPQNLVALHKRFENVELTAAGIGHNFTDWWVRGENIRHSLSDL
ncbi:MAG: peptide-binding protein [Elusimicrobia bacterium]|nr:peptide-binding protein [Elusimicrobiota bacterium]